MEQLKVDFLKKYNEVQESYDGSLSAQGGLSYFLANDVSLKEIGDQLYEALMLESESDTTVRNDLENRYESAINSLRALEDERNSFEAKKKQNLNLMKKLYHLYNSDIRVFQQNYNFENGSNYDRLGRLLKNIKS